MAGDQPYQGNPDGLRFAPALTRLLPGQEISFQEGKAEKM
jgi:putative transposase